MAEIWLEIVVKLQFVSVLFFSSPSMLYVEVMVLRNIQKKLQNIDIDIYEEDRSFEIKKISVKFHFSKDAKIIKIVIKSFS